MTKLETRDNISNIHSKTVFNYMECHIFTTTSILRLHGIQRFPMHNILIYYNFHYTEVSLFVNLRLFAEILCCQFCLMFLLFDILFLVFVVFSVFFASLSNL